MDERNGLSRRSAVAGFAVALWAQRIRPLLVPFAALSAVCNSGKAQTKDPIVIVEVRTTNLPLLERIVRRKGVEIIRVIPAAKDGGVARAVIALKKSEAEILIKSEGIQATIVSEPPAIDAEVPEVGKGNRFRDPQVLPPGRGVLVKP